MAAAEVDDGKTAKTEAYGAGDKITVIVGATMADRVRHALDESGRYSCLVLEDQFSADAAHL